MSSLAKNRKISSNILGILTFNIFLWLPVFVFNATANANILSEDDWFATADTPPAFFWTGLNQDNDEGPFTYSSSYPTIIDITDDFLKGDQFEVFNFGTSIGFTSLVPVVEDAIEVGPNIAFADPTYSSGSFLVSPGSYSLTIQAIGQSLDAGRGYIRIRKASVPEPISIPEPTSSLGFLTLGVLGVVTTLKCRQKPCLKTLSLCRWSFLSK
ncbi:PEP-CTERM sorting domain-containing protein [Halotia branconii]|uniref:PEP-CTERM sorting domain-containing protein n=1 Tax=Halotia branconii CENA392 TaxID=1539056 RepID=A0AAJ6PBD1_9CYAN|nr:PEP-CTERM sorting domain-containing protein [Halotia branconii]WGV27686.1 PEP-CTERM sorting domain-containing protein [Halotia branconii CENA392]